MIYLGIDPGAHGGIAVILPDEVRAAPMPSTGREILNFLQTYRPVVDPSPGGFRPIAFAVLEQVWGMPGWGAANFKFGKSYGMLQAFLIALKIPYEEALPKRWQQVMGVSYPKRADGGRRDKNIPKRRAEALFPQLTITHATADALLIAAFCQRLHGGQYGKESGEVRKVKASQQERRSIEEIRRRIEARAQAGAAVGRVAGHGSRAKSAAR